MPRLIECVYVLDRNILNYFGVNRWVLTFKSGRIIYSTGTL